MGNEKVTILTKIQVEQKLNRIAHEIYENHFEDKELVIVGIADRGYILAKYLVKILQSICDMNITLAKMEISKKDIQGKVNITGIDEKGIKDTIILVDDVLNTGKTLINGVKHLLNYPVTAVKTVILVNRRHRTFPIRADYVGLTLSTTLKDHIQVELKDGKESVYLT